MDIIADKCKSSEYARRCNALESSKEVPITLEVE